MMFGIIIYPGIKTVEIPVRKIRKEKSLVIDYFKQFNSTKKSIEDSMIIPKIFFNDLNKSS